MIVPCSCKPFAAIQAVFACAVAPGSPGCSRSGPVRICCREDEEIRRNSSPNGGCPTPWSRTHQRLDIHDVKAVDFDLPALASQDAALLAKAKNPDLKSRASHFPPA